MGLVLPRSGIPAAGRRGAEPAATRARRRPLRGRALPIYTSRALASFGVVLAQRGRFDRALRILERAGAGTAAVDLRYGQATVLAMLAHAHVAMGQHDLARDLAEQSLAIARARGERGDMAWALHLIGSSALATSAAAAVAEEALAAALAMA